MERENSRFNKFQIFRNISLLLAEEWKKYMKNVWETSTQTGKEFLHFVYEAHCAVYVV